MKPIALTLMISFLFATLFLSFTLAMCGTEDTPICSSIFGMSGGACAKDPLAHHTAIAEQPTLCTLDALAHALLLFGAAIALTVVALLAPPATRLTTRINVSLARLFRVMNPFDALRFAFLHGTVQRQDVHQS